MNPLYVSGGETYNRHNSSLDSGLFQMRYVLLFASIILIFFGSAFLGRAKFTISDRIIPGSDSLALGLDGKKVGSTQSSVSDEKWIEELQRMGVVVHAPLFDEVSSDKLLYAKPVWPRTVYKNEAFVLKVAFSLEEPAFNPAGVELEATSFSDALLGESASAKVAAAKGVPEINEDVQIQLIIAGAEITPKTPQRIGPNSSISWSVKFVDRGFQEGFFFVTSDSPDVQELNPLIMTEVFLREDFEYSIEGVFSLLSGVVLFVIAVASFWWNYRDRKKKEDEEIEASKPKLIIPGAD